MTLSLAARAQEPGCEEAERCLRLAENTFDPTEVRKYADSAYNIAQRLGDKPVIARALENIAWAYTSCGIYDTAIVLYKQHLLIDLNLDDKNQAARTYCNLGLCYQGVNNYFNMWDNFRQAVEIYTELRDTSHLSWSISSMGDSYFEMGIYHKAKELYYKALHLAESINDTIETGVTLHKIANCTSLQFFEKSDNETIDTLLNAKKQFVKAAILLKRKPEESKTYAQNLIGLARCYIKLANLMHRNDFADSCDNCLDLYVRDFHDDNNTRRNLQSEMIRIQFYIFQRNYAAAMPAIEQIIPKFSDGKHDVQLGECYRLMSSCYNALGDYRRSFECSELHMEYLNKSHNDERLKSISNFAAQTELYNAQHEYDLYNKRQLQIMETEQSRQRFSFALMSLAIAAVVVMTVLISLMLHSRRQSNRLLKAGNKTSAALNMEYLKQLQAVADAQSIIVDSMEYASMIQSETIGNAAKVKEMFPDSSVYYRPRDIVSGDWYYSSTVNGLKMVVAADCTGHGIPGAMLCMLGVGALRDVINKLECIDCEVRPGAILDKMRVIVKSTLNKNNTDPKKIVDDGMEMTIIVFPPEGDTMYFAGANQSALIEHDGEVTRLKGNTNSIGNNIRDIEHFTTITTKALPGDSVYLFSDGVIDQIGGAEMRKFSLKQLMSFMANNRQLTMNEQLQKFSTAIDNWTGEIAQLDDRLLIGIRI